MRSHPRFLSICLLACAAPVVAAAASFEAEVRWTQYGVPHVKAANYAGLGYGYGNAIAGHHLCLLADRVWTLRAERSLHFGASGSAMVGFMPATNLDSDLFYRVNLGDVEVAGAWRQLSSDAQDLARGYAAGFNRYVRELEPQRRALACANMPLPIMEATDVVRATMQIGSIWKAVDVARAASQSTWENLLSPQSSSAPSPASELPRGAAPAMASNAWAFGSDVTGTGSSIVVANPHSMWIPHWLTMHQMHLTIPGQIDVMGADFVGLPLPVAGYTNQVAWSLEAPVTVNYHLLLALNVQSGPKPDYLMDGKRRALTFKTIELGIREDDGSVRRRAFRIPYSHLGALYRLEAAPNRPAGWYAITDASYMNARGLDQLLGMARARNIGEFEQAVASHRGITAHLIAGDRHGKALFIESGPLLDIDDASLVQCFAVKRSWEGVLKSGPRNVLDGSRSPCATRAADLAPKLAPAAKLPALHTAGIVQNTNDSYRFSIFGQQLKNYSLLLGDPLAPVLDSRILMSQRQIQESLQDKRISVQEAADLVWADRNYAAETSMEAILAACASAEQGSQASRACSILSTWNRRNTGESRGTLLFHEAWSRLESVPGFYSEEFDPWVPFRVRSISRTPAVSAGILQALEETTKALEAVQLHGDEPWGSMLARTTPQGRLPLHGGEGEQGVLNAIGSASLKPDGYQRIINGSSYIHVVTWEGDRPVAGVMVAHGQSSDPASVHYADQIPLFEQKLLSATPFTDAQIAADPAFSVTKLSE